MTYLRQAKPSQNETFAQTPIQTPAEAQVKADDVAEVKAAALDAADTATQDAEARTRSTAQAPQAPRRESRSGGLEQALAGRWFVVIGGIAVALGGLLFVKYAHDNGLIPPILRIIIGYAFAAALAYAGENVRRNRADGVSDHVPAALSAAGLVIAFGVTYAAYALYGIFSPAVCFPLLVAIGLAALWLSRRQGPLIAALGLIGSFASPALVPSEHPNAWGFFAYLIVIVSASFYELRLRPWWWLGYAAIAGAFAWGLLWMHGGLFEQSHVIPAAIFAYALAFAASFLPRGYAILKDDVGTFAALKSVTPPLQLAAVGVLAAVLILASVVVNASYTTAALALFLMAMALLSAFGWLKPQNNIAAALAAVLTLLLFMAWPDVSEFVPAFDERGFWVLVPQLVEPSRFVSWMIAAGTAFTALGILGVIKKPGIRYWDSLTAGASVLFVFGAWAKAEFALSETSWAVGAAIASAPVFYAAWSLRARVGEAAGTQAIWNLLVATALLAVFVADRLFDHVWLTLALAALVLAFAWLARHFDSRAPAAIAAALASFVALRLFFGREFWSDQPMLPLAAHWPIYGYGIPAILFWLASRQLASPRDDKPRVALEGLSLGLLISLISLELRVVIGGGITREKFTVAELGSHVVAWLGAAFGLAYRQKLYSGFVARWGTLALVAASTLVLLALLTGFNPVFTGDPLIGGIFVNSLWLGFLLPAALLAVIINRDGWLSRAPQRTALAGLAMVLVMTFATLMVKNLYHGPRLVPEFISDAESYTVSLVWLAMGVAAFVAGLRIDRQSVRLGGIIVLILTVLKVFILDLSGLTGLWRIASLMGLGFCLIGIGWLYTRFAVHKQQAGKPADPA